MIVQSDDLKTTFELPDAPTYREILRLEETIAGTDQSRGMYERYWAGVCQIARNWQAPIELRPDLLDQPVASGPALEVVKFAALSLAGWYVQIKRTDPNS